MVSKLRAAAESFVRTFAQSFFPSLALVNFTTTDISGLKTAAWAAGTSAFAAAIAAAMRVFYPIQTDVPGAAVEGAAPAQPHRRPPGGDGW